MERRKYIIGSGRKGLILIEHFLVSCQSYIELSETWRETWYQEDWISVMKLMLSNKSGSIIFWLNGHRLSLTNTCLLPPGLPSPPAEVTRSQEPGARSQELGARSQEPGARSQEPGARTCGAEELSLMGILADI